MPIADFLQEHNGIQVKIAGISNTRKMVFDADGISLDTWEEDLQASDEKGRSEGIYRPNEKHEPA